MGLRVGTQVFTNSDQVTEFRIPIRTKMEFTINQIAAMLRGEVQGNGNEKINMLGKIQDAKKGQIAFLANPKYEQFIYTTQATAVIVKRDFIPRKEISATLILVDDPYTSFTRLLEEYHKMISLSLIHISEPTRLLS